MARNNDRDRTARRAPKDTGRRTKKKVCIFCKDHIDNVSYREVNLLRKFMSDRGKIRSRRVSGNCEQHQRDVATAIKTARELVLLPYTQRTTSERPGGRGTSRGPRPSYSPIAEDCGDVEVDIEAVLSELDLDDENVDISADGVLVSKADDE